MQNSTPFLLRMLRNAGLVASLLLVSPPVQATADVIISKLGTGGCRTANGGQGKFIVHHNVTTEKHCLNLCSVGQVPCTCTAVEYN